jgi:DNA helicase-2/ATP-dependent DNA helicase PcrA
MNHNEKIEVLAQYICGKPPEISPSKCRATIGATNPLCNECETCRIARNSDEQLDYVLSSIEDCMFLKACPGSGKTEVVGMKAAYEISKWAKIPGGIAVLTFTNNAAEVIEKRVSQFGGVARIGFPHFIGTIDGWLHGYIAHPFAHLVTGYDGKNQDRSIRLVDATSIGGWLNAYKLNTSFWHGNGASMPLYANNIQWDPEERRWNIFIPGPQKTPLPDCDYYDSPAFAKFRQNKDWLNLDYMRKEFLEKKKKFLSSGFATYQDIECICYELLSDRPELSRILSLRFPFIIIDECQDLSWIQMQILDRMRSQGTVLHFVGDLNQAIYEFKKVAPEKVEEYTKDHEFNNLSLTNNYRNCQSIASLCDSLVGNADKVKSINESNKLENPCICMFFEKDNMMKLPISFNEYLDRFGIGKQCSAIVTRSWANVYMMRQAEHGQIKNYQHRLAMAIHLWKTGCREATGDALKLFGRFVSEKFFFGESTDPREYYQPESVDSALTWRSFMALALRECCQDKLLCNLEQNWKTWSQIVRDRLHKHLKTSKCSFGAALSDCNFPPLVARNNSSETFPVFATPSGESDMQVMVVTPSNSSIQAALRITTIHNVKGETLEALMLVSSRDKSGRSDGYWTQWLDDPASEAARLAYVASSRPRRLIIWAIPNPSKKEESQLDRLRNIGFKILAQNPKTPKSQTNLEDWAK